MKFSCLLQYSEYGAVNRDFPDVPTRLLGDIYQVQTQSQLNAACRSGCTVTWSPCVWLWFQLGGDFLVDHTGKVLASHPCDHPLDRPTVADVLQAVDAERRSNVPL